MSDHILSSVINQQHGLQPQKVQEMLLAGVELAWGDCQDGGTAQLEEGRARLGSNKGDPRPLSPWKHTPSCLFSQTRAGHRVFLWLCYSFAFAVESMLFSFVSNLWMHTYNYTSIIRLHIKPGDYNPICFYFGKSPSSLNSTRGLFSK